MMVSDGNEVNMILPAVSLPQDWRRSVLPSLPLLPGTVDRAC